MKKNRTRTLRFRQSILFMLIRPKLMNWWNSYSQSWIQTCIVYRLHLIVSNWLVPIFYRGFLKLVNSYKYRDFWFINWRNHVHGIVKPDNSVREFVKIKNVDPEFVNRNLGGLFYKTFLKKMFAGCLFKNTRFFISTSNFHLNMVWCCLTIFQNW